MKKISWILLSILLLSNSLKAQSHSYAGWLVWSHIQKINQKLDVNFDVQLRSSNQFEGIQNILIRPGISYSLRKNITTGLGYTFITTKVTDHNLPKSYLHEQMIWEQIQTINKIGAFNFINRIRLEQRFIEQQQRNVFSERLRIFNKIMIPLSHSNSLNNGIYLALQDEVLLNVQNKSELNHHNFDQNRAFGGFGHAFNKHFTVETGYQQINVKGISSSAVRHIAQISMFTKLGN